MSEYGSPASEGPNQTMDTSDANNSLINKVKSRVSSIFPQRLTQWFSPSTSNSSNGNLRRRRHDSDNEEDYDNYYSQDPSGGDNLEDSDIDQKKVNHLPGRTVSGFSEKYEKDMPLPKKSRLNADADCTLYQNKKLSEHVISSTPMSITINRNRKHLGLLKQQPESTPYTFTKTTTSKFLSGNTLTPTQSERVSIQQSIQNEPNFLDNTNIDLPERISSRRSLNIPRSSLDKSIINQSFNYSPNETMKSVSTSLKYKKHQLIDEVEEASEEVDDADEEDEEVLEDDDDEVILNAEIKIAQKLLKPSSPSIQQQQITNGLRSNRPSRFQQPDTASESGESQQSVSSHQRPKSGLFNPQAGQKRSATINGLNFYSHLEGKKSLFSEKNLNTILNNSTLSLNSLNRRQHFNSSLYGSTSALSDSRLLNTTSPFYKGRTTYGGASAYNRYSQQRITPTLIRPSSSLSIASSANSQDTQNNSGVSSTAKRILELMNQFTTPLGDAKKLAHSIKNKNIKSPPLIEHRKRFSELDLIEERRQAIRLGKVRTPYSRSETMKSNLMPPSNELQVPSMAQLLQLNKLQNSTEKVRELANTNTNSILNKKTEEYKLPGDSTVKPTQHVNKIKQKITTTRQKSQLSASETVEDVNLPDIPLPFMKSIPTFNINLQKQQCSTSLPSTSDDNKTKSADSKSDECLEVNKYKNNQRTNISNTNIKDQFKCGDSIATHIPNHIKKTSLSEFKFSSPINLNGNNSANFLDKSDLINNHFKFSSPTLVTNNEKQSNNNSLESKSPKQIFDKNSIAKIPQLRTGSVLDALKTTSTSSSSTLTATNSGFGDQFKKQTNQWSCEICLINNNDDLMKCAACETPRKTINTPPISTKLTMITSTALTTPSVNVTKSFGNAFKPKSGTWECDVCMVRNDPDATSCASCTTSKPGINLNAATSSKIVPKADDGFKTLVVQQTASKWECSACMTRNDSNQSKCACCEQSKPDSNPTNIDKPKFSFGNTSPSTKFNFGFGGSNPKEDEIKKTTNTLTKKIDEGKQSSGFIFGTSNAIKSSTDSTPPQGEFSFGFKPLTTNLNDQKKNNDTTDMPGGFKFDTAQSSKSNDTSANNTNKGGFSFGVTSTIGDKVISESATGFKMPSPKSKGISFKGSPNKNESQQPELVTTKILQKPSEGSSNSSLFGVSTKTLKRQNDEVLNSSSIKPVDASKISSLAPEPKENHNNSFVFGNTNQTSTSAATPLFGASSNTTTTSVSSPLFGMTSSSSVVSANILNSTTPIKPSAVFGDKGSKTSETNSAVFSKIDSTSLSFAGTNTLTTAAPPTFNTPSNLFAFGGKTENKIVTSSSAMPVFASSSLNSSKIFNFGASTVPTTTLSSPQTSASLFFGKSGNQSPSPAPSSSTSLFGSNNNITFGSSTPFGQSNAAFGQSAPTDSDNLFAQPPLPPNYVTFGNQNSSPAFGSSNTNTSAVFSNISTNSTGFGAPAPPTFGGTANPPTFGSSTTNPPPVFGSSNSFSGSGFGSAPAASSQPNFNFGDVAAKKQADNAYNFNAPAIPSGGFSFGLSNNNNNNNNPTKPAFNFTPQSAPTFNFTGSSEGLNSTQPFQFGATSPNQGGFTFGGVETPSNTPFQFAASAAATNLFAPTPSPNLQAQQVRRKIRTAQRRSTQPR